MHIENIVAPYGVPHLANGLQKRQPFNVPHRAAHFHHHHIGARFLRQPNEPAFDFVGQMRHRLDGAAQKIAPPFPGNQLQVGLPGGNIAVPGQLHIDEPLVVAQIQVRLPAVPGHENLPVLIGRHSAGIHIQVRIQLDHGNGQPLAFENAPDGRHANALADGAHHPAGYEYVLGSHKRYGKTRPRRGAGKKMGNKTAATASNPFGKRRVGN